jgi:uracil-DNA glycosylase
MVPMEAGGGDHYFSVEVRTNEVRKSGRLPWYQDQPGGEFRNAHMKGVTLALRLAFNLRYADRHDSPLLDHETERLSFTDDTDAHLFECFAMANLLLCSAVPKQGSQKSLANAVMRANCIQHLVATINILQPTLVISQGWSLVDTLWDSLCVTRQANLNVPDCYLTDCNLNGNPFAWVALYHPTRFWSSINQPYFKETAVPAIRAARRRALRLAQTV